MNEDHITSWFAEQTNIDAARFPIGIGDDMAQMVAGADGTLLITCDMLLDGTHFDLSVHSLAQVGYKAMAASLSDCAGMATIPVCAVGATALPVGFGADQLKQLHAGIQKAATMFDCPVIGGDMTKWSDAAGRFAVNITMLSKVSGWHEPVRRSRAKVGDTICVTGMLGGSLAGGHLDFTPRVREALAMTKSARLNAMMDITDGLSTDMNRICKQSGVGARIEAKAIPLSEAAKQKDDPLAAALNDGEDFELLFTVSPDEFAKLPDIGVPITPVGEITDTRGMEIEVDGVTKELLPGGFEHL